MIYLDSSVALSYVFTERKRPAAEFWNNSFVSSRLLQYEIWNRVHDRQASRYRVGLARDILRKVGILEMTPAILARALRAMPSGVRTLDGLHLATAVHLANDDLTDIVVASYDRRMVQAAAEMGFGTISP